MNRRKFIRNSILAGISTGLSIGLYSWQIEPFWLEIVNLRMPVKNLPAHLQGKRVMQISDIHVGNRFDYQFIIESFKKAQLLKPDIVVYTGDYVSYENEEQFRQLEEVLKSTVRGRIGTFGILGNHDYGHNWSQEDVADQIASQLELEGVAMLRNESEMVHGLNFIGLDDYYSPRFSPESVLAESNSNDKANIVLCHNPDVCDLNVWSDYKGWILAGHTHGGQVRPPFTGAPVLPIQNKAYAKGKIDLNDGRHLYVNRALGHLWQVRLNVRPEITLFELVEATV